MDARPIKPDFHRNILNVAATLAEYLGCPNQNPTLPALAAELNKDYKNVVFLIADGLGTNPVRLALSDSSFLKRRIRQTLTSVFPSTTTNATATLLTNKYPMEHGRFGWSLYFEQLKRAVDIFPGTDSETGEQLGEGFAQKVLPLEPFYKWATRGGKISLVVPAYWDGDGAERYICSTFAELFGHIGHICGQAGKQFLYAYCPEPDATMHRFGVSSAEARQVIGQLDDGIRDLYPKLPDTLWIVTADHGQVDIGGNIELFKDAELLSLLEWPPYLEARAPAFKVKAGCLGPFTEMFEAKYGNDFILMKSADLIRENYFGPGYGHADLLGDLIAVGITDKVMMLHAASHEHRGHHGSLTAEMEVPLIWFGDKTV